MPGGIAGVAAGAVVYLVMRRGKARLQQQLDRLQAALPHDPAAGQTAGSPATETAVERHHNRYVPYEVTQLDKAWAAAHAHVGENIRAPCRI